MQFNIPILLIIFNRPVLTQQVFSAIRKAKPDKLYVAADGPRIGKDEEDICKETRDIIKKVDWQCEVKTLFRNENLGCGRAPKEAIDWLFRHEDKGIILEDDCLPNQTFFPFCQELLNYYEDDTRIMHIAGSYFLKDWKRDENYSYHFSQHGPIWGWATWRRAWKHYDYKLELFAEINEKGYFDNFFLSKKEQDYRLSLFQKTYKHEGNIDWWDYQWDFARFTQGGLSIVPNVNLVSNLGFGEDATHTLDSDHRRANLESKEIKFPLKHPPFVMRDIESDRRKIKSFFLKQPLLNRIKRRLKKLSSYE